MNYNKNWLQRFVALFHRSWVFSGTATLLLTLFNVAVHGPRDVLLHLGLHALRVPFLRLVVYAVVGPVSLMLAGAFALIWIPYRPSTLADMVPISSTVAEYGHDDFGRFVIVLQEYRNSFVAHAEIETFDAQLFTREVQPGDRIHFMIHKDRQNHMNDGELLAVFEIRSDHTTFVGWDAAVAAEHHDCTVVLPWTAKMLGTISAACVGIYTWDSRRSYAYCHTALHHARRQLHQVPSPLSCCDH